MADTTPVTCTRCRRSDVAEAQKTCEKCQVSYCSTDCLKADKTKHQKRCGKSGTTQPNNGGGSSSCSTSVSDQPFTHLQRGTYLHDRTRQETFRLLLDCYRLRVDDDLKFDGINPPSNLSDGFGKFLEMAANRGGLLPSWWDREAATECRASFEGDGRAGRGWNNINKRIGKDEVNSHYGNGFMAMQLRLLGEGVYGRGPGGQPGAGILQTMASSEQSGGMWSTFGL